ncbi:MAG: hypothetical protein Q9182_007608, partial [Xanthomendoza sp. 2 TL-2023]
SFRTFRLPSMLHLPSILHLPSTQRMSGSEGRNITVGNKDKPPTKFESINRAIPFPPIATIPRAKGRTSSASEGDDEFDPRTPPPHNKPSGSRFHSLRESLSESEERDREESFLRNIREFQTVVDQEATYHQDLQVPLTPKERFDITPSQSPSIEERLSSSLSSPIKPVFISTLSPLKSDFVLSPTVTMQSLVELPDFHGEPWENSKKWVRQFNFTWAPVKKTYGDDDESKCTYFEMKLKGKAGK